MLDNNQIRREDTIDLGFILLKLWNFKTIRNIILFSILCGICAFAFSKYCIDEQFTSYVNMYVNNNSVVTNGGKVDVGDINASQKIVESCTVILKDDIVMDEIAKRLIKSYSDSEISEAFFVNVNENGKREIPISQIKKSINISGVNETEVLSVSVTTKSPEISLAVCEYVVDIAPDMVKRVIDGGRIEAVGKPRLPLSKSYPDNNKNALKGFLVGAFLIIGYYVLKILLDNKITNREEFNTRLSYSVLAEIPFYKNENLDKRIRNKKKRKKNSEIPDKDSFDVVEAYNSLCSNILFSCRANDTKVIILSSSEAGAGKSTISCRIAESLNNSVGNVLLIDCDMRRPTVHKKFNLENKKGLSTILSGIDNLKDIIFKKQNGINVITSGPTPPNVAEILSSKYMDEIMNECIEKYNYIIIDTPPINIVNDAAILSKYGNGVIFVARSGSTRYNDLKKAEHILKIADTQVSGVVINAIEAENQSYGKYGKYGRYSYYSQNNTIKNK